MKKVVTVQVPATSGNIGPGFDVLGLALSFGNFLKVRVLSSRSGRPVIRVFGKGGNKLPKDARNLIFKGIKFVFAKAKKHLPQLELECVNNIPLARGLGSSSAAVLSGMLAANRLLNNRFKKEEILAFATQLEGHPDNVAPALYGGVQAVAQVKNRVISTAWPIPDLHVIVAVPHFELSTKKARQVIPKKISMKDAISNLSAVALMPHAFSSDPSILVHLLNDRWHEPYRAKLIPGFYKVKEAAIKAGSVGVTLSGAGPTILSFATKKKVSRVASAMHRTFKKANIHSRIMELRIDSRGAVVR